MKKIRWHERFENFKLSLVNINETHDCILQNGLNKIYTMALIQAFEISFELAWKTMKDYLEYEGIQTDTPRQTIKTAFLRNLIPDGQLWIDMMEARNKTSHTYNENFAKSLNDEITNRFLPALNGLETILTGKINE